jgi:cobalt-zinc-cadmium efflux system outer membrane protein
MKSPMPRFRPDGTALALLVAACALLPVRLAAQGLTLRQAVDSALRNNPDLGIARSLADSARSETRIASALPNPQYAIVPNTPTQYSATVALDVGPQRIYRMRASDAGARATRMDVDEGARQVVLATQRAYYDVLLADARRTIVTDRRGIMRQLVLADSARVRAGDIPERALIRSVVELVRADADVARAAIDAQTVRLTLQGLMGVASPDTALRLADVLTGPAVPVDTSMTGDFIDGRPDVAASRVREAQSVAAQHLAGAAVVPVPQLTVVRQYSAPFESGRYYALGLGFEIPIFNQYRGQRERAAAGRDAAAHARQRVELQASRDVRSAVAQFRAQQSLLAQYESGVIARVEQNVEATRYAYSRGATSLLEVLDALRAQQDVLTDYYTALHDYRVAGAALDAARGVRRE